MFSHAQAALDATACRPGYNSVAPGAVKEASGRLAAARSQPGKQQLALADALAELALLSARQNGSPDIGTDGNPAPAELLREAQAIWNAARPGAALTLALRRRGLEFFNSQQCLLGREVLESALRVASASEGPNGPDSIAIAHDLLRIGLAQRDDALVRRLAPAAKAALDARTQPIDARDGETLLALIDFFYSRPGDSQQDLQLAEQLALRVLALTSPGTATPARRELSYRLASIYYAQLRYADGEALRPHLANGQLDPFSHKDEFARQRDELIALVRKGDLQAALGTAYALLDQHRQSLEASRQRVAQADAALAQHDLKQAKPSPALAQAVSASRQAHARQNLETVRLATVRSYLGEILHATGDLDGAAAAYETALADFAAGRNSRWEDRTRTRSGLAILYRTRGDYARALTLQQQVLDELLPLVGEAHPDVQEARAELALLRKLQRV